MTSEKKKLEKGLLRIEKKYAWSFLGFLLALIFGGITIYSSFLVDKSPDLNFIILSNVKVLDINANVRELDIIYKNENIIKQDKNLSILTVKIENTSDLDILSNYYDPHNPLGIEVENATIVEKPEIIDASTNYLKQNVEINQNDSLNFMTFSNVIIDKRQYFSVKILLLHKSNEKPIIKPIGKIAGIENIDVINLADVIKISFWNRLLQGSVGIHLLRFLIYIILLIIVLVLIFLPQSLIGEAIRTRKRKKLVLKYREGKKLESSEETDFLFDSYISKSKTYLTEVQRYFRNKEELKEELELIINKNEKDLPFTRDFVHIDGRPRPVYYETEGVLEALFEKKIVQFANGEVIINEKFENELNEFVSFLKLI
ncbi:MAG: hypothetical protein M1292_05425 [Bacteroidetes bacterium]|nr:hypothetical protein [Bacteroidota bacterium]